jgi:hypothetical protein
MSPSGVYVAYLTPNVQFEVQRGSVPVNPGPDGVWGTPVLNNISSSPNAYANLFPNGEFGLYDSNFGDSGPVYSINLNKGSNSGTTLSLNDSGTLTINQNRAPGPLGAQLFSNNIGDPVTSIALSDINYNLAGATNTQIAQVAGGTNKLVNNTAQTQSIGTSLSLGYTKTSSWNFGASEAITHGTGVFAGGNTGDFTTEIDCVSTRCGCKTGPVALIPAVGGDLGSGIPVGIPSPVPEPASLPLLPAALPATAMIRRLRTRSERRAGRRSVALRGASAPAGLAA